MKVTILQENLAKIVGAAARSVSSRPQLPVLANILLKAEKGKLIAVGTDMMTSVGLAAGGKVEEEGAITAPARDLAALANGLPAGTVELWSDGAALSVSAGRTKAKLMGMAAADFPEVDGKGKRAFEVDREGWGEAMEKILVCVSPDEGRPILTGVKVERLEVRGQGSGGLRLTATDGYRLGVIEVGVEKPELDETVVIPARTLGEAVRLAAGKILTVELTNDGGVCFRFEDGWVKGKLLAGEFPAVDKIIPTEFEVEISVDRGELEKAVKLAAIFARESANIIKFRISASPAGGQAELKISANSPQIGENETEVEITGKGSGEIAFNSRYLLDLLGSVSGVERLTFKMAGPLKPGVFGIEGDKKFKHVIMPVRVQK